MPWDKAQARIGQSGLTHNPPTLKGLHVFSAKKTEVIALHISSRVLLWHEAREKTLQLHGAHKQDNCISAVSALFVFLAFVRER